MSQRLVLFDIDGTLVSLGRYSGAAVARTLGEIVGPIEKPEFTLSFSGKTDRLILRQLMAAVGHQVEDFEELFQRFLATYPPYLREELGLDDGQQHPPLKGVPELLSALAKRDDITLGIVTGNTEPSGWMKLEAVGLRPYFGFGAFGCQHEDRSELVRMAITRGSEAAGRAIDIAEVYVVGDSPRDFESARATGTVAVGVATGPHSFDDLIMCEPDYLFEDFTELEDVLGVLTPGGQG